MKIYETSLGSEVQISRQMRDLEKIQDMYSQGKISGEEYRTLMILSGNYVTSGSG